MAKCKCDKIQNRQNEKFQNVNVTKCKCDKMQTKCKCDEYLITSSKDSPGAKTLKPFDQNVKFQNAKPTKCKCHKM